MAQSNRELLTRAFDLLVEGLAPLVDDVMTNVDGPEWNAVWAGRDSQKYGKTVAYSKVDPQILLRAVTEKGILFKDQLSRGQQAFASELRDTRNLWAHGETISSPDTERALDTIARLLQAVDAMDSAADVSRMRDGLQRSVIAEQARSQTRRSTPIADTSSGLPAWREVVQPHDDVARGSFSAAEFAADLHEVSMGAALAPEYADPVEFFSRTYLTDGLRDLLTRAVKRMSGDSSASPVVNLQNNFGGGKTHSLLALHHLFSGTSLVRFPQDVQDLVRGTGISEIAQLKVNRVALVGTALEPAKPQVKDDGTRVATMWGELAWQLGGRSAYDVIADADRTATNPGESLRELLRAFSPALILIDEWVAYARQLVGRDDLPAGTFETQFTFAQTLTEAVRSIPGCMLVVSVPASDEGDTGADIEVGGENGHRALEALKNVIGRVADQWRPSSKDESFEIVRRRIFKEPDAAGRKTIDVVAKRFIAMYGDNLTQFPREVSAAGNDYEARIRASYPLHPELLDRLYEDWSTLPRFQRTRGVLTLVSSIVSELWASNDSSPLIMPGTVPLSSERVNTNLTQYLEDRWKAIIDADIDGHDATSIRIDRDRSALGQRSVTRRIARTIFMGSAPRLKSRSTHGLDKQYVWLGTAVPKDVLGNFTSALEQLGVQATYFYEDQGRYWFDTRASVQKVANDYAERLREDPETVWKEVVSRLAQLTSAKGLFARVHLAPGNSADVPDVDEARLVVLHPRYTVSKGQSPDSPTLFWARGLMENKGSAPRVHRNTLVFLAADRSEEESVESAVRSLLGWNAVLAGPSAKDLTQSQKENAESRIRELSRVVDDRLRAAYVWLICPEQFDPTQPFELTPERVPDIGATSLAERTSTQLKRTDRLVEVLAPQSLAMTLHNELSAAMAAGDIAVGDLWGYFTDYVYMPRLVNRRVLEASLNHAVNAVFDPGEEFALALGKTETAEGIRYQGLIVPPASENVLAVTDSLLVVEYNRAVDQQARDLRKKAEEREKAAAGQSGGSSVAPPPGRGEPGQAGEWPPRPLDVKTTEPPTPQDGSEHDEPPLSMSFYGAVDIDPKNFGRQTLLIAQEVVDLLKGAAVDDLAITLDIRANKQAGFSENEERVVKENVHTLKFREGWFD